MNKITAIVTIVGPHFWCGRRLKGVLFLFLLAILPLAVGVATFLLSGKNASPTHSADISSSLYLLSLAASWSVSALAGFKERSAIEARAGRRLESIVAAVMAWFLVLWGMLACVMVPLARSEHFPNGITLWTWTSKAANSPPPLLAGFRPLPVGDGDTLIIGKVSKNGRPFSGEEVRLTFSGMIASTTLVTDNAGEFTLRLPKGTWYFRGPVTPTHPDASFSYEEIGRFNANGGEIVVLEGPPTKRLELRIDVGFEKPISRKSDDIDHR